ncbi:MAG: hypothetical protein U9N59_05205 [Campylobacterota bacterium]|nr:hypothetical protein [Campylobacterota bacterium]
MKTTDFDELPNPKQNNSDELEIDFDKEDETKCEEDIASNIDDSVKQKKAKKSTMEINISSAENLITHLSFSAKEINESLDRVEKNRNLSKILDTLTKIGNKNYTDFYYDLSKNIDSSKIEKVIDEKINNSMKNIDNRLKTKLNNHLVIIENATKKYEKYGEAFENPEVFNTFEQIEQMESFFKKFRFKSIVFSALGGAIMAAIATGVAMGFIYNLKLDQINENILEDKNEILSLLNNNISNLQIVEDDKVKQLHFKSSKINFYILNDGTKVIGINKN